MWIVVAAGRLQKPVVHLVSQRPSITEAQQGNLHAAAAAALLLLPPTFTTQACEGNLLLTNCYGTFALAVDHALDCPQSYVPGVLPSP
jgi:hypothetical protein